MYLGHPCGLWTATSSCSGFTSSHSGEGTSKIPGIHKFLQAFFAWQRWHSPAAHWLTAGQPQEAVGSEVLSNHKLLASALSQCLASMVSLPAETAFFHKWVYFRNLHAPSQANIIKDVLSNPVAVEPLVGFQATFSLFYHTGTHPGTPLALVAPLSSAADPCVLSALFDLSKLAGE